MEIRSGSYIRCNCANLQRIDQTEKKIFREMGVLARFDAKSNLYGCWYMQKRISQNEKYYTKWCSMLLQY